MSQIPSTRIQPLRQSIPDLDSVIRSCRGCNRGSLLDCLQHVAPVRVGMLSTEVIPDYTWDVKMGTNHSAGARFVEYRVIS